MDNKVAPNQVLKSHEVEPNASGGLIVRNQSGFSTIYRLIDLCLVTLLYYASAFYYHSPVTAGSLLFLFVFVISFQLSGEFVELYRSWRGHRTNEMLRAAAIAWALSMLSTTAFGFFFFGDLRITPPGVLLWAASSFVVVLAWRYVMRKFLFRLRRSGLNSRKSIVIGASQLGYNMANQIVSNEHLGIRFLGMFDDRSEDRLPNTWFLNS